MKKKTVRIISITLAIIMVVSLLYTLVFNLIYTLTKIDAKNKTALPQRLAV